MANLYDYLTWRGDLAFSQYPFNDLDALVFARLSYIPFDGIVPAAFTSSVSLGAAVDQVLTRGRMVTGRRMFEKEDEKMLKLLLTSPRFSALPLCGYEATLDPAKQEQFAALTVRLLGETLVAYRGTDDTLVGWKEDFNMAFSDVVPAQLHAVEYLSQAANTEGFLRLCGHSKGGNLAIYAAAFADESIQSGLLSVHNFDGPGFSKRVVASPGYQRILPRVRTILPEDSIVGMLLERKDFTVVASSGNGGITQHNVYLWQVMRAAFVPVPALSGVSLIIDKTLTDFLRSMAADDREKLINGIYAALEATKAETLYDLRDARKMSVLKAILDLDEDTRKLTMASIRAFYKSLRASLPEASFRDALSRLSKRGKE